MKRSLWCTQTVFLSKQVLTTVAGRRRDAQTIEVSGAYTLLRWFSTTRNKEASRMASAFLEKYDCITAVDLIQWKKLDSRNFLIYRKPDLKLILYRSIRIMIVYITDSEVNSYHKCMAYNYALGKVGMKAASIISLLRSPTHCIM